MINFENGGQAAEFNTQEGMSLAVAYLENPAAVPCPRCGPDTMEVVCFLDARQMEDGVVTPTPPDDDYTVVLYCHECGRAAALDLSRSESSAEGRNAA